MPWHLTRIGDIDVNHSKFYAGESNQIPVMKTRLSICRTNPASRQAAEIQEQISSQVAMMRYEPPIRTANEEASTHG